MIHGRLGHPDQAPPDAVTGKSGVDRRLPTRSEKGNSGDKQSGWTNDDEKSNEFCSFAKEAESLVMNDSEACAAESLRPLSPR